MKPDTFDLLVELDYIKRGFVSDDAEAVDELQRLGMVTGERQLTEKGRAVLDDFERQLEGRKP